MLVTHHVEEIPVGYTHGMLLREGRIVASGLLDDVLTDEALSETFGLPLAVAEAPRPIHGLGPLGCLSWRSSCGSRSTAVSGSSGWTGPR